MALGPGMRFALPGWGRIALFVLLLVMTVGVVAAAVLRTPARDASATDTSATTGTTAPSGAGAATVVFVGDAYTVGQGSSDGAGFVTAVADQMGWNPEVVAVRGAGYLTRPNQSQETAQNVCGEDYCRNYPELISDIVAANPDVVIVSGGRVNVSDDLLGMQAQVALFYVQLRAAVPDAEIYAISPLWDDTEPPAQLAQIGDVVNTSVTAVGGTYVNIGQPLVGNTDLVVAGTVVPNDQGYSAIAAAIVDRLN